MVIAFAILANEFAKQICEMLSVANGGYTPKPPPLQRAKPASAPAAMPPRRARAAKKCGVAAFLVCYQIVNINTYKPLRQLKFVEEIAIAAF